MMKLRKQNDKKEVLKKEKRKLSNDEKIKLIKRIIVIGLAVIILELIIMAVTYINKENKINYLDGLNDIEVLDDGYIAVGSSNFRNSKDVSKKVYTHIITENNQKERIIANQAKLVKYNKNLEIVWERTFPCEYDSSFNDVIKVEDGYVAVGKYVYEYSQLDLHTTDALIVKYDLNGNMLWFKNYQILGDSSFNKVIESNGNYVVIGQSIYENLEVGNHTNGGGVIVSYSKDGELLSQNNYGGNKSGLFNDIYEVEDGYIICGKDAANYGILLKFKKDFNREEDDTELVSKKILWNTTFPSDKLSFTSTDGFRDLEVVGDKIYITSAINVSENKDKDGNVLSQHDAGLLVFDINGRYQRKYTFGGDKLDRYDGIIVNDDNIIVIGCTTSTDIEMDNYSGKQEQSAIIVKYDMKGNILEKKYYGEKNNTAFMKIMKLNDNKNIVIGTTNAKKSTFGYDYQSVIEFYDNNLNLLDK